MPNRISSLLYNALHTVCAGVPSIRLLIMDITSRVVWLDTSPEVAIEKGKDDTKNYIFAIFFLFLLLLLYAYIDKFLPFTTDPLYPPPVLKNSN